MIVLPDDFRKALRNKEARREAMMLLVAHGYAPEKLGEDFLRYGVSPADFCEDARNAAERGAYSVTEEECAFGELLFIFACMEHDVGPHTFGCSLDGLRLSHRILSDYFKRDELVTFARDTVEDRAQSTDYKVDETDGEMYLLSCMGEIMTRHQNREITPNMETLKIILEAIIEEEVNKFLPGNDVDDDTEGEAGEDIADNQLWN